MKKILIELSDDAIYYVKMFGTINPMDMQAITKAIENGTPLKECGDCVDRQKVLDAIEKAQYSRDFCKEHHIDYSISMEMVRIVLHDLPPVTPKLEESEECVKRSDVVNMLNFEDKWLLDCKSHNANTVIAFESMKSKIKGLSPITPKLEESEDCVKREDVLEALRTMYDTHIIETEDGNEYIDYNDTVYEIEQLLPVQPKQKVGHDCNKEWVLGGQFICSECNLKMRGWYGVETRMENARDWDEDEEDKEIAVEHYEPEFPIKYCPKCGCKMEGE